MDKAIASARLEARLPADIHAMLKRAADMQGRTLTDFVVSAARDAAKKTIEDAEIFRLSMEDQFLVSDALLNPPKPNSALRQAFKKRKQLIG